MISLDRPQKMLNRQPGMIFSPDTRDEIATLRGLVELHRDASPVYTHRSEPLSGDGVFHRRARSVGNVLVGSLAEIEEQDSKNGTPLSCIKLTYDEAVFLQDAAREVAGQKQYIQYKQVAAQILAINLRQAA